jgi:hypothetical protein
MTFSTDMRKALRLPTRNEVRDVARLAAPIVVVQVGLMLMGALLGWRVLVVVGGELRRL